MADDPCTTAIEHNRKKHRTTPRYYICTTGKMRGIAAIGDFFGSELGEKTPGRKSLHDTLEYVFLSFSAYLLSFSLGRGFDGITPSV